MSDLVGNPEDRFSRVAAHLIVSMVFKEVVQECNTKERVGFNSLDFHYTDCTSVHPFIKTWLVKASYLHNNTISAAE